MAGIGFELKKLLGRQTFMSDLQAYVYASIVSSGPWLMSIICLALLGLYRGSGLTLLDHALFRSTVIYTFAFTLIFIGIIQLVATRFLADSLYEDRREAVLSSFLTSTVLVLVPGAILAIAGYWFFEVPLLHKFLSVLLFLVVAMIWLCMIYLSAVEDYNSIVYAFAVGSLVSIAGAVIMGAFMRAEGYLLGYLIGQAVILFWVLARILVEFPVGGLWEKGLLLYFKRYWDLMLIGFIYNLGIWIDKFVFWTASSAHTIVPYYRTHDLYEGPIFFSYLTIIPSLAMFLLKIETRFYDHYQQYYARIIGKMDLRSILEEKSLLIRLLKENVREVFILQGGVSLTCIVLAPYLIEIAQLSILQLPLFRIALVGSFLQVLMSINIIVLFYFDFRKCVLAVVSLFCFLNGALSWLSLELGFQFYGYGYTYACLISLLFAFYMLHIRIRDLEYITFCGQPVL